MLFNLPCCKYVKTHVARKFISIIEKHFNKKCKLSKIINNITKLSYWWMTNTIKIHNVKIIKNPEKQNKKSKLCNCRN